MEMLHVYDMLWCSGAHPPLLTMAMLGVAQPLVEVGACHLGAEAFVCAACMDTMGKSGARRRRLQEQVARAHLAGAFAAWCRPRFVLRRSISSATARFLRFERHAIVPRWRLPGTPWAFAGLAALGCWASRVGPSRGLASRSRLRGRSQAKRHGFRGLRRFRSWTWCGTSCGGQSGRMERLGGVRPKNEASSGRAASGGGG